MSAAIFREGFYPFPPYINVFSYTTPFFFTPTTLLAFVSVVGLCRYLHTKQVTWQDISSPLVSPDRRLSPLSKLIVYMCCLITMSYLLDTAVVVAQVFIQGDLSTILVYYIGVSWLAWTVSLLCLMDESHKFSKWHWLQYTFFALATLGETIIAWLWTVGIYKPRPGKNIVEYWITRLMLITHIKVPFSLHMITFSWASSWVVISWKYLSLYYPSSSSWQRNVIFETLKLLLYLQTELTTVQQQTVATTTK